MKLPAYNARIIPRMQLVFIRRSLLVCLLLFAAQLPATQLNEDWSEPLRQLAQKVVASTGPGAVAVSFQNRSAMNASDADRAFHALLSDLQAVGVESVDESSAVAKVQVTLSENATTYLWIAATTQSAADAAVVMVPSPRRQQDSGPAASNAVVIRKTVLWIQPEPILDAALISSATPTLLVLSADKVAVYAQQGSRWQLTQQLPIPQTHPWPRDLRGRLFVSQTHLFDAYLPGLVCEGTASAPLGLVCRQTDDPWPLGVAGMLQRAFFASTRNHFTGVLAPGFGKTSTLTPFYSAAPIPRNNYTLWITTGTDGALHLADGVSQVTLKLDWGSGITSVKTGCGSGWQLLATSFGDGTQPDSVRAYEIADREPIPASAPEPFPGPVTALWTQTDGTSAVAVTRNLKAGTYEAYRLAITCTQ